MNINWKPTYIPGDLVYNHKGEVIRITSSYLKGTRLFYYKTDEIGGSVGCILEEALKPIPLTPEILEKNGWKLLKHHKRNSYDDVSWSSYHKPAETNISLIFYQEEKAFFPFLYAQEISEAPIRYIHQLQHLLFGLGLNSEMEV